MVVVDKLLNNVLVSRMKGIFIGYKAIFDSTAADSTELKSDSIGLDVPFIAQYRSEKIFPVLFCFVNLKLPQLTL